MADILSHRYLKTDITISLQQLNLTQTNNPIHVRCSQVDDQHQVLMRIAKTETLKDHSDLVEFQNKIQIDYLFQQSQRLCFSIHADNKISNREYLDYHAENCGFVYILAADIIQAGDNGIIRQVEGCNAKIILKGKIINPLHSYKINLIAKVNDLDKKDFPLVYNCFYQVYAKSYKVVETGVIDNCSAPAWKEQVFDGDFLDQMCHELIFKVWDRQNPENIDEDELIGQAIVQIGDLTHNFDPGRIFLLTNPKKKYKSKKRQYSGKLIIEDFTMIKQPEFFGLLQNGLEFNFHCAVDFTASNLHYSDRNSLHYKNESGRNLYSDCLQAVGNIITAYDFEKLITGSGFGAITENLDKKETDFFELDRDGKKLMLNGIDGLLDAYYECRKRVNFSNTTNVAETISRLREKVMKTRDQAVYHVLLIIIDNEITDMLKAIEQIKRCDDEPISIYFLGLGNKDFGSMHKITEDDSGNKILRWVGG